MSHLPSFVSPIPLLSQTRPPKLSPPILYQTPKPTCVLEQTPPKTTSVKPARPDPWPPVGSKHLTPDALERAKTGNKVEKLKLAKDGSAMWTEVWELAELLRRGDTKWEDIGIDDIDTRLKWAGLFHRRKRTPGKFMMRLKVPNGILESETLRWMGGVLESVDGGCGDITTRMNLQLRNLKLDMVDGVVEGLLERGLTCFMSGMDNVRNMVGSPIAGIDPLELVDTRELCWKVNEMITGGRKGREELSNLPRKFNIAISGSRDDFSHTKINDIGLEPMANPAKDGEIGFNVHVGGFFSIKRNEEAIPMDVWLPQKDVVRFCEAVLLYFRDNGDRKNRQKSRLMYMLDQWGIENFRAGIGKMMGYELERAVVPPAEYSEGFERRDIQGVHPQKQEGLSWVCANVPAGRLHVQDFYDIANVADKYSKGEARVTVDQNVLFPNVANDQIESMLKEGLFERFKVYPGKVSGGLVSCTGAQFCGIALIETKNRAIEMAKRLEEEIELEKQVRIHWTGCPNSCGQVQVADIGLMGAPARKEGKAVEGVNIFLGGKVGEQSELGAIYKKGVPCDFGDLIPALKDILVEKFGAKVKA